MTSGPKVPVGQALMPSFNFDVWNEHAGSYRKRYWVVLVRVPWKPSHRHRRVDGELRWNTWYKQNDERTNTKGGSELKERVGVWAKLRGGEKKGRKNSGRERSCSAQKRLVERHRRNDTRASLYFRSEGERLEMV